VKKAGDKVNLSGEKTGSKKEGIMGDLVQVSISTWSRWFCLFLF